MSEIENFWAHSKIFDFWWVRINRTTLFIVFTYSASCI